MRIRLLAFSLLTACLLHVPTTANAAPQTLTFVQTGWTGGGASTLTITVDDLDNNGQIVAFPGSSELVAFEVVFSGNSLIADFATSSLSDLFGFVYDLDGGILGDGATGAVEGFGLSGPVNYVTGPGPYAFCDGLQNCGQISDGTNTITTMQALTFGSAEGVANVPEPASLALFGLGLVGLCGVARRRG